MEPVPSSMETIFKKETELTFFARVHEFTVNTENRDPEK